MFGGKQELMVISTTTGDTNGSSRIYEGKNKNTKPKLLGLSPSSTTDYQYDFGHAI